MNVFNAFHSSLYSRRVSALERYALAFNQLCAYNAEFIVEGQGRLDIAQWRAAIEQVGEANPGCRVRYRSYLGQAKWMDSGEAPEVHEIKSNTWDGQSSEGAGFLKKQFTPLNGGPVFDILLFNGDPARALFRACHGAFDGRGALHVGLETFRALRGEPLMGSQSTLTDVDVRALHREKISQLNRPMTTAAMPIIKARIPGTPTDALSYIWRRITVAKKIDLVLPKIALFLAEFAAQNNEQEQAGSTVFIVPVDYRGLRTDQVSTGNLSGSIYLQVQPGDTPIKLMKNMRQSIKNYHDCSYSSDINIEDTMRTPISQLAQQLKNNVVPTLNEVTLEAPSAGLVSLGHTDLKAFSFDNFTASSFYGIPAAIGRLNVFFHNYPNKTEILLSAPELCNSDQQFDVLVYRCEQHFSA